MVFYGLNRDRWNHTKNKTGTCFTWAMILFGYICGKFIAPYRLPYSAISQQQTVQMVTLLIGAFSAFFSYASAIIGAFIAILVNRRASDKGTHPAWIATLFIMPILVSAFARYGMLAINAAAWLFILYVLSPVFLFVFLSRVIFPPEDWWSNPINPLEQAMQKSVRSSPKNRKQKWWVEMVVDVQSLILSCIGKWIKLYWYYVEPFGKDQRKFFLNRKKGPQKVFFRTFIQLLQSSLEVLLHKN